VTQSLVEGVHTPAIGFAQSKAVRRLRPEEVAVDVAHDQWPLFIRHLLEVLPDL
jgi:hypothetical protein